MPINNRDGGLSLSLDEVRIARAALFLAIHHRHALVSDQAVNTFTGRHLVELTALMAHLDELLAAEEPTSTSEAHRLVLSEHLEKALLANDNELIRRPSRLEWLLQEAHRAKVFVPPELERRLTQLRAETVPTEPPTS